MRKKRNYIAQLLQFRIFRQRIKPNKKKFNRKKLKALQQLKDMVEL